MDKTISLEKHKNTENEKQNELKFLSKFIMCVKKLVYNRLQKNVIKILQLH